MSPQTNRLSQHLLRACSLLSLLALCAAPRIAEAQYRPRHATGYSPRHARPHRTIKATKPPTYSKAESKAALRLLLDKGLVKRRVGSTSMRPVARHAAGSRQPHVVLRSDKTPGTQHNLARGRTSAIRSGIASSLRQTAAAQLPSGFKASQLRFRTQRVQNRLPTVGQRRVEWYLPGTSLKGTANAFTPNMKNGGRHTQVGQVQFR